MPGIGAFLTHRVPAYYSAKDQIFMPPHRELGFNPQVTVDDALLLSEYMNDGLLSYEEANSCLANDIDSLRSKLSDNGVVCFGDLGTFEMDIEGKISFIPNENSIDDPQNYGFEPLVIAPLKDLKKKDIVIKHNSIGKYVSAIAAAIIIIFVLAPFGNSIYDDSKQMSIAGFTPVETVYKPVIAQDAEIICEIAPVAETVTEHIFTTQASVEPTVTEVSALDVQEIEAKGNDISIQYSIIVASTPNPKNAQLAITELSRKMQADYKVVEGDRRFRIAIESYNSEEEANIALERIQTTFSDAWVYIH